MKIAELGRGSAVSVFALALLAFGCSSAGATQGNDAGPGGSGGSGQGGSGQGGSGQGGSATGGYAGDPGFGGYAGDPGFGGYGGEAGSTGSGGGGGGSCDTSAITGAHWWTPDCPGYICYDTQLNSDGTYQKQRILLDENGALLCEHGTWQALDCGTIEFVPCYGGTYQQSWAESAGAFELQGVDYVVDPGGIFNCGPNDC